MEIEGVALVAEIRKKQRLEWTHALFHCGRVGAVVARHVARHVKA